MQNRNCSCMQQPMNMMPCCSNPMAAMPQQQLAAMFPQTFLIIKPVIDRACDEFIRCGQICPSQEQLDAMIDNIYCKVEVSIEAIIKQSPREDERQFIGGGRRILRDFIGAALISNLISSVSYYNPAFGLGFISPFGFGYGPFVGGVIF